MRSLEFWDVTDFAASHRQGWPAGLKNTGLPRYGVNSAAGLAELTVASGIA